MELNLPSSPLNSGCAKADFCKPSNDVVNRKYRRRSSVDGSSSSDGSPIGARSSSSIHSKENPAISFDDQWRNDDRRHLDREYGRSHYGRTSQSHKHSDRHSSRSTSNYSRHYDYKREKYVDEDERKYPRLSSRSGRESRSGTHSDYTSRGSELNRSRDNRHNADKYAHRKTDGSGHRSRERDGGTSPVEYQKVKDSSDRVGSSRRQTNSIMGVKSGELDSHRGTKHDRDDRGTKHDRHNSTSQRDSSEHQVRETSRVENKELDIHKYSIEEKKKHNLEYEMEKEKHTREAAEKSKGRTTSISDCQDKKPRLSGFDGSRDQSKFVSRFTTAADDKEPLNSQKAQILVGKGTTDEDFLKDSDIDAAKVAAVKAAELVNKNLVGTGYMTADQKKKLLWGSKKSTPVEESTHRWDATMFSDRERQEKFNKLMTLRLHWYLWPIVGCEGRAESRTQSQTGQPRRKQCHPSREAESTTAGSGKAIHCWAASERWPYCWTGSLGIHSEIFLTSELNVSCTLLYNLEVIGFRTYDLIFALDYLSAIPGDIIICKSCFS